MAKEKWAAMSAGVFSQKYAEAYGNKRSHAHQHWTETKKKLRKKRSDSRATPRLRLNHQLSKANAKKKKKAVDEPVKKGLGLTVAEYG